MKVNFKTLGCRLNEAELQTWAEQLRKNVADNVFEVDEQSTSLTCTIGLSEILHNDRSTAELLDDVEKACRLTLKNLQLGA